MVCLKNDKFTLYAPIKEARTLCFKIDGFHETIEPVLTEPQFDEFHLFSAIIGY